jgi:hypothetical protein
MGYNKNWGVGGWAIIYFHTVLQWCCFLCKIAKIFGFWGLNCC